MIYSKPCKLSIVVQIINLKIHSLLGIIEILVWVCLGE